METTNQKQRFIKYILLTNIFMFNNTKFVQLLYILIAITIVQISKGAIKHTDERN